MNLQKHPFFMLALFGHLRFIVTEWLVRILESVVVLFQRTGQPCFTQMIWYTELRLSTTYIQPSHMVPRSRLGTELTTPRRFNSVRVVGRFTRSGLWKGTPLPKPSAQNGHPSPEVNALSVGGRISDRRNWFTSTCPCKLNRQDIALWTIITTEGNDGHKLNKWW